MSEFHKLEKTIGSAKFAVTIILLFASILIYGTFMESYHGTDYANRYVYKSTPFMLLQFLMFLSIFLSTLMRLPLKKSLYGFYILHLGLLTIFCGSFITFYAGVDGSMTLPPNTPARLVALDQDVLYFNKNDKAEVTVPLPYTYKKKTNLKHKSFISSLFQNKDLEEAPIMKSFEILEYLPFADEEVQWIKGEVKPFQTSAQYFLANPMFSEKITLSLHELSDFESNARLGPLSVIYLPKGFSSCFTQIQDELVIWDTLKQTCLKGITWETKSTESGTEILLAKGPQDLKEVFLPKLGPLPVFIEKEKLFPKRMSPLRIFNKSQFQQSPHLFLFGDSLSYYLKDEKKWETKETKLQESIDLPWMNFAIKLQKISYDSYPTLVPVATTPIQDSNELVVGKTRALKVRIKSYINQKEVWVKENKPLEVILDGENFYLSLRKETIKLPFQMTLDSFKMDTDPGTSSPASYESFLTLFQNGDSSKHHVFMNNPLEHLNLTFYQSSYFQDRSGNLGSVLSINYDPGRFFKYLGSILLVFGSLWHFVIRRKIVSLKKV